MKTAWTYEDNVFLNVTDHNYLLMRDILNAHVNMLAASPGDPFYKERHDFIVPVADAFNAAYDSWLGSGGTHKGETLTLNQLLALSTTKLNGWMPFIQQAFPIGSGGFTNLFPQGRRPFNQGNPDNRISAFSILAGKLPSTGPSTRVKTEVQAYWQQMNDQRDDQQQALDHTAVSSSGVETLRINAADALFENLGLIMAHNARSRPLIKNYFPLDLIRRHHQVIFHRHLQGGATVFLVKHTFALTDQVTLEVLGTTGKTTFWLAATKDSPYVPGTGVTIDANAPQTVTPTELGGADKKFLKAYNPDANVTAEFEVQFG